ncbi:hypothetical protein HYS50_02040 [Candidatus Woesearchaeota archaeon]|nr:hypothetical protein [Candidatus Woesearchaeota archaeon]
MNNDVPWGEFCNIAGPTPRNRVLEFFIDMKGLDYTAGDIASFTQLNRATTYNTMEELIKEVYLIPTRKVSGSQLYKINEAKREVKVLIAIFDMILDKIAEEYAPKASIKQRKEPIQET